jgi:hypothetical protein
MALPAGVVVSRPCYSIAAPDTVPTAGDGGDDGGNSAMVVTTVGIGPLNNTGLPDLMDTYRKHTF